MTKRQEYKYIVTDWQTGHFSNEKSIMQQMKVDKHVVCSGVGQNIDVWHVNEATLHGFRYGVQDKSTYHKLHKVVFPFSQQVCDAYRWRLPVIEVDSSYLSAMSAVLYMNMINHRTVLEPAPFVCFQSYDMREKVKHISGQIFRNFAAKHDMCLKTAQHLQL